MERIKTQMIFISMACMLSNSLFAQEFTETITKELLFDNNTKERRLTLQNVNGYLKIEGYDGHTIKMEVEKIITAKNQNALQQGISEINIGTVSKGNHVYVHLISPWTDFKHSSGRFNYNEDWKNSKHDRYQYILNFKVKVPSTTNIKATTINGGDVVISDVFAHEIMANNINGAIILTNVSGQTNVKTLNKDISVNYHQNPDKKSTFNTLNGNIDVTFQDNLNASVSFKSLNGELYTNFEALKSSRHGTSEGIKRSDGESFKVGNGGTKLDFHVLNGNVYLRY